MTPYLWIDDTEWECVEGTSAMVGETVTARLKDHEPETGVRVDGFVPCSNRSYLLKNGDETFHFFGTDETEFWICDSGILDGDVLEFHAKSTLGTDIMVKYVLK